MARRWHRPGAFAIVLTLAGVALFVWLGTWQVRRAHEKLQLFAAFDAAAAQEPIALEQARREADPARYPRVRVGGRYDPDHAYVLDNQVREGRPGVMVFDVFEPSDGSTPLLANRGFLARDARGEPPPIPPPPSGEQTVTALYAPPPGSGLHLGGNALPRQKTWPKTSIYIDLGEVAADLGRRLDPRVLLLVPGDNGVPGSAFVREWRPEVFPPERHYGYAFTWFMFAAVAVAIFVIRHWRKEEIRK
ncbi:SURF1 family protein [Dokdonella soli]|uniref:SURF1-like protein n=1 Tax=Dokdonella soli TaxID=529810 RepID=A0ABN1IMT9_9GAMM